MAKETILIASDHNGNEARDYLVEFLRSNFCVVDLGPRTDVIKKVDYTEYAEQLAYAISKNENLRGILICGTGVGMSIAANRFKGVRASLVSDVETAKKTREHNNSNVLVLGSWNTTQAVMNRIVSAWFCEEFGHGRHEKRVAKLDEGRKDKVVVVPGVFEIVHPGHISLFEYAASLGKVVVALNDDDSAERVKGRRPISDVKKREKVLRSISYVDEVIAFSDNTPGAICDIIGASYMVKGGKVGDDADVISKHDNVSGNTMVKLYPLEQEYSSSKLRESLGSSIFLRKD